MKELIEMYLKAKEFAWAPTTLKSERARLMKHAPNITSPVALWKALEGMAPYARVTTYNRITTFIDWAVRKGHRPGPNEFREWREENARQFKHVYQPKLPTITFEEALRRIETIADPACRQAARDLLKSGLRSFELAKVDSELNVVGKGSKPRKVFGITPQDNRPSYFRIWRALRKVGLKPHTLRKILMTELARRGLQAPELCAVAGWTSFNTASSYIAAAQDKIQKTMESLNVEIS